MRGSWLCLALFMSLVAPAMAAENVAPRARVIASSSFAPSAMPHFAVDESLFTAWVPAAGVGAWIELDLDKAYEVHHVVIRWEFSIMATWRLETFRDGNWVEVARGIKEEASTIISPSPQLQTDRLRLLVNSNNPVAASILDIQVWSNSSPSAVPVVKSPAPIAKPAEPSPKTVASPQPPSPPVAKPIPVQAAPVKLPAPVPIVESKIESPSTPPRVSLSEPMLPALARSAETRPAPTAPIRPVVIPPPPPPPRSTPTDTQKKIASVQRPAIHPMEIPIDTPRLAPSPVKSMNDSVKPPDLFSHSPSPALAGEGRGEGGKIRTSLSDSSHLNRGDDQLQILVDSFEEAQEAAVGSAPVVDASEGSLISAAVTPDGQGRGGTGKAYRAAFVVVPDGKTSLTQRLGAGLPENWTELSFWMRGSWAVGAPLELTLRDNAGKQMTLAAPGTEGGSKDWRQVKIPSSVLTKIDRNNLQSYALRFTDKHQSGEVFIDDVWILGGVPVGKKSVIKFISSAAPASPASSSPVDDWDNWQSAPVPVAAPKDSAPSAASASGIPTSTDGGSVAGGHGRPERPSWSPYFKAPIRQSPVPLTEVRVFDYTDKDRKAVHDMLLSSAQADPKTSDGMSDDEFLDLVERRAFLFYWYCANPENGITLDGASNWAATDDLDWNSIAAVGFGLTAMCIGAERGWITRDQAFERCRVTLAAYLDKIQNNHGFFYHFTNRKGVNDRNTELSSVDSTLLFYGILFAGQYFKGTEIESMARKIYERVDWKWMHNNNKFAAMGAGANNGGFINAYWDRHCEGQMLAILELGHPQNMPTDLWFDVPENYGTYEGFSSLNQGPLFTFQFPECWIDFRDRNDGTINFWENAIEATLANRYYALDKAPDHKGYGPNSWGFTAGDFPGGYHAFAAPPSYPGQDGTITINAAGGSVMLTPQLSIRALRWMYDNLHDKVWGKYGFTDGYNLDKNWSCPRMIGIGTGPMMLSIENYRSGFVWDVAMKIDYIQKGLDRIGFKDEPRRTTKVWPLDLSGNWKWNKGDNAAWSKPDFDDSRWRDMYVPDKWETEIMKDGDRKLPEYDGFGWYRLRFEVPRQVWDSWQGQDLFLHIGAIDDADVVFLNGEKIGATGSMTAGGESAWEKSRKYAVPQKLVDVGGENVLAVRVFDASGGGGIWMRPVEFGPYLPLDYKPWKVQ